MVTDIRALRPIGLDPGAVYVGAEQGRGDDRIPARLSKAAIGQLGRLLTWGNIVLEDGSGLKSFGHGEPSVRVRIHDPRAYSAFLLQGSVGMGQSYIDRLWDCDDLTGLMRILVRNRGRLGWARDTLGHQTAIFTDPLRRLRRRPPSSDHRYVRAHYDIGNEFFSLMLDPTMSYSCGYFANSRVSMEEASVAKMDRLCSKLGISSSDHILEIGSGWGGFAIHAAEKIGCRVTTTTVSVEQYDFVSKRVADLGISDRVTVLQEDFRRLSGQYDKLVSIEMIEAVEWRQVGTFFRKCSELLRPEGLMALQAITINDHSYDRAKSHKDYIKAFVFPGSCLPSVASIAGAVSLTDLRIVGLEDIGPHYANTLRRWQGQVNRNRDKIKSLGYDERFLRLWDFYLSYCEAGFVERHVSDVQVVLTKPLWRPRPAELYVS